MIVCPESQRDAGEAIVTWVQKRAIQLEGTVTGEHGIGLKLRDRLVDEVGVEAVDMMRKVSYLPSLKDHRGCMVKQPCSCLNG